HWSVGATLIGFCLFGGITDVSAQATKSDWPYMSGSLGSNKYSPLELISRKNVAKLKIVWRHSAVPTSLMKKFPDLKPSHNLKATPIIVNGVLVVQNSLGLVEALNPITGKTLWMQEPPA